MISILREAVWLKSAKHKIGRNKLLSNAPDLLISKPANYAIHNLFIYCVICENEYDEINRKNQGF